MRKRIAPNRHTRRAALGGEHEQRPGLSGGGVRVTLLARELGELGSLRDHLRLAPPVR